MMRFICSMIVYILICSICYSQDIGLNTDSKIHDRLINSTVRIWQHNQDDIPQSMGSGTIIDYTRQTATILTCEHVLDADGVYRVHFFDTKKGYTKVIHTATASRRYTNEAADIGIIQVKCDLPLKAVKICSEPKYSVKDEVIGIGCEFGAEPIVRYGQITELYTICGGLYENIETKMPTINGVSGGGLFNIDGELIGIRYAVKGTSIGFNVGTPPIHKALRTIDMAGLFEQSVLLNSNNKNKDK